jgi:hypothetical protein
VSGDCVRNRFGTAGISERVPGAVNNGRGKFLPVRNECCCELLDTGGGRQLPESSGFLQSAISVDVSRRNNDRDVHSNGRTE